MMPLLHEVSVCAERTTPEHLLLLHPCATLSGIRWLRLETFIHGQTEAARPMNGWDFSILYQAGLALLQGHDPYSVPEYFYPFPFTYALALLALPGAEAERLMWLVWGAINLGLLLLAWRGKAWQWLLYFPVLHQLSAGQVELLLWFGERHMTRGWRAALLGAFITLKPQTAFILLPYHLVKWLREDRPTFLRWLACTAALWGLPLLWRPDWLTIWLGGRGDTDLVYSASVSTGIFTLIDLSGHTPGAPLTPLTTALLLLCGLLALGCVMYGLLAQRNPHVAKACLTLANPFGLFYTHLALMGTAPWWVLASVNGVALLLVLLTGSFLPNLLTPLAVLAWARWQAQRATAPATSAPSA